ncbi:MAG: hypothetical protein DYG98_16440 [Haliscomenobacteraceae bacterium CHB4]|nr:hypothetical protein [Saprospiraceae bacterium]MCE7924637.1 hypothetical protein [Haliscomenobacteraceae bacterium CHB4]
MAFVLTFLPHQNQCAAKPIMKSKNKSIATICILLFHLGLLYLAYEKIAGEPQPKAPTTMQNNLP